MTVPGSGELGLREVLRDIHQRSSKARIVGADAAGAFREPPWGATLQDALPIVVDANTLRGDIARNCRVPEQHTILVSGSNSGAFRLYVADHVISEVDRNVAKWSGEMGIDEKDYRTTWETKYVPLLRHVETCGLEKVLTAEERRRIDDMGDRDDVPSATLAVAVGALFLSEDKDPYDAVYRVDSTLEERRCWLDRIRDGGNSAEMQRLVAFSSLVSVASVLGFWQLGRWVHGRSPSVTYAGIAALATAAAITLAPRWRTIRDASAAGLRRYAESLLTPYFDVLRELRAARPPFPCWEDVVADVGRDCALRRACLFRLARSRNPSQTAAALSAGLPALEIATSPSRVGRVLRQHAAFFEPYRGVWQLGEPISAV